MSDDDRLMRSDVAPLKAVPASTLRAISSHWLPTKRLVIPYFELVISEQREPDPNYVSGYNSRRHSAIPHFAIVNTQPTIAYVFVSFVGFDGGAFVDMAYEGSLDQLNSVEFNVADHPKLAVPALSADVTEADLFWQRRGWFNVYSSVEVQVDAWIKYYHKSKLEQTGHDWARSLAVQESSFIRHDAWMPKWDYPLAPRE